MRKVRQLFSALAITLVVLAPAMAQTIELVPVVKKAVSRTIDLPGEFQPFMNVALYARVAGYVETVVVDRGSVVKQGDLLVVLSAPEMKAQVAAAESKVQAAEADRAQAESKLASLEANAASTRAAFEAFITRLRNAQDQDAGMAAESRVLSPATVPQSPTSPR